MVLSIPICHAHVVKWVSNERYPITLFCNLISKPFARRLPALQLLPFQRSLQFLNTLMKNTSEKHSKKKFLRVNLLISMWTLCRTIQLYLIQFSLAVQICLILKLLMQFLNCTPLGIITNMDQKLPAVALISYM